MISNEKLFFKLRRSNSTLLKLHNVRFIKKITSLLSKKSFFTIQGFSLQRIFKDLVYKLSFKANSYPNPKGGETSGLLSPIYT